MVQTGKSIQDFRTTHILAWAKTRPSSRDERRVSLSLVCWLKMRDTTFPQNLLYIPSNDTCFLLFCWSRVSFFSPRTIGLPIKGVPYRRAASQKKGVVKTQDIFQNHPNSLPKEKNRDPSPSRSPSLHLTIRKVKLLLATNNLDRRGSTSLPVGPLPPFFVAARETR